MSDKPNTPKPKAEPKSSVASSKTITYIGLADVREIDADAWAAVGATDQPPTRWDKHNRWQVSVDELTPAALAYCETDPGFAVRPLLVTA